jgi:hypothetical protein
LTNDKKSDILFELSLRSSQDKDGNGKNQKKIRAESEPEGIRMLEKLLKKVLDKAKTK